jgi:hypothetical protein
VSSQEPPRPPAPPTQPTRPLRTPAVPVQPVAPVAREAVVERFPPELPPEGPWWENPWPALIAGVLCLLIGGLIGYLIGHRAETSTEAGASRAGITHTVTRTNTVVRPKVVVHTDTVTARTVTQTPAPVNSANEERRTEAEANLRRVERENEELRQREEG